MNWSSQAKHGGQRVRKRVVVALVGLAVALIGCSSTPPSDSTTVEKAARRYVDAYLHGSSTDFRAAVSNLCAAPTDAALDAVRAMYEARLHMKMSEIKIESVETRNLTSKGAEAWVHLNLPSNIAGNDNWVTYVHEKNAWVAADCTRPPFGNNSSSSPSPSK